MKIKVSDSFRRLMSRVDCKIIISEAWLGETDQDFTPNKNSLIQIPANGIWEEETTTLKVLVIIPEENIVDSNDQRQEFRAIYFFSSINSDEPAFVLYDLDEPLSLGRNLINIEFSDIQARIEMVDTSEDTKFLETFGQNPGKSIYLTNNESALVTKNTYYVFWRVETTNDDTTDLPILDPNGKLITENYTYKTYSNLRISCPGLTRTSTPPARFGLSDDGGVVPITGIADFTEYKVFGGVITETISGEITIEDIPGSEIIYISGHNDLGQEVGEAFNIFTPNNYSSMIEYKKNDYPGSYGADGIFGLRVRYYDVKEQRPVTLDSINQIKLVRRDVSDNWFILDKSSRFIENTEEFGEVPVFMFPYDTSGNEYLIIRTKFLDPIVDPSQITVTNENDILNNLFRVNISLSPYTDENGTYFVDIYVRLSALTTNTSTTDWAPILNNTSTLLYTKVSYGDYFSVFYLIQKPNIIGSLKLVDQSGNRINQIRMGNNETSLSYYVVCDAEEDPGTDFYNRPVWKVIEYPTGLSFVSDNGYLSPEVRPSYSPNNRLTVNYPTSSTTAQNIYLSDIKLARIKESGISENLMTTTNWRFLVDIAQINVGFMKYGRNIDFSTPTSLDINGIGLYELSIRSNCRFTLTTTDQGISFRNLGDSSSSSLIESPSYNDTRYLDGRYFKYWVQVGIITESSPVSRGPISITIAEEDRTVSRDININQPLVSDSIYKLKLDGTPYSDGSWELTNDEIPHERYSWVKRYSRESTNSLEVSSFNIGTVYYRGDVVKYYLNSPSWDSSVEYVTDDIVYFQGDWWKSLHSSNINTPSFDSVSWICITKYFICINQFTPNILGDSYTYPMEYSPTEGYTVHSSYWQEIMAVNDFDNLSSIVTNIHSSSMYDSSRNYSCGDIVRYGVAPGSIFDVNAQYHSGDEVKIGSSDPFECYKCISYNNSSYLSGIIPGVSDSWQLYWEAFDPYMGFICNKDCINETPDQGTTYWSLISGNIINLPRNRRFVGIKSKSRVYLYMDLDYNINGNLTLNNIVDELTNDQYNENAKDIKFILDNPSIYKTGFSVRFFSSIIPTSIITGSNNYSINTQLTVVNTNLYFYIKRDNTWVDVDDIDTLINIFNNQYSDKYFLTPGRQLLKSDYQNKINYSYLIAPGNRRDVYAIQEIIVNLTLNNILNQVEKQGIPYLFPHYSSYSSLPSLDCIARDVSNRFIKVVCRIDDGGKVRAAIINPDISNYFRPIYPTNPNNIPVLVFREEWNSEETYNKSDIVYCSNQGNSKVYYWCKNDNVNTNPAIDTSGAWECISWTALPSYIITNEDAIRTTRENLNLNSDRYIGVRGVYETGTTLFNATITIGDPKLGDIIKIGATYYYFSLWKVVDVPTTQSEVDSLITTISVYEESLDFMKVNNYFLCRGFSNVLIKGVYNVDKYYYVNSSYIFNNIGSNRYIFIPEHSIDYTVVRYHTRKTPTEELNLTTQGRVTIINHTTPEFNEDLVSEDHYLDHFTCLKLAARIPDSSYIPQVQTEYEGKLTLSNPVNQNNSSTSITNIYNLYPLVRSDLRYDKTRINYHLYKEPYAPLVQLYQGNREITLITLENFYNPNNIRGCTTEVDIVSPHPISVFDFRTVINRQISVNTRRNYNYSLSNPSVERDGLYHYKLSIHPTTNNNSVGSSPIKLGDLYITSRIRKNGTKPFEWVVVEDSNTGIEILKRLLRSDRISIYDLNSDINGITSFLPDLEEAIPGLVYRGTVGNQIFDPSTVSGATEISTGYYNINTRLFVALPYDFVKDDSTNNLEKYYYSQEEIDDKYGVYQRRVSIIQKSSYEFEIIGDKTTDIDFIGETRTYNLNVIGTNWNGNYIIGNEENCMITNNSSNREITMHVPSRILNYSPKLISDSYYVGLKDKIPVSFSVLINSVVRGPLMGAGQSMMLPPASSISSTYTKLDSEPTIITHQNTEETNYKDEYSGLGLFIRTVEKYDYYSTLGLALTRQTGYSYQKTSWNYIEGSNIANYLREHNNKYGDNIGSNLYGLSGIDANSSFRIDTTLPNNADDIVGFGYYKTATPGINDPKIKLDNDTNLPKVAQFGTYYTKDNITYKKFCPCIEDRLTYSSFCDKYYKGTPEWKNVGSIEEALVDLRIANEFIWEETNTTRFTGTGYDTTPINLTLPIATRDNFRETLLYWKKSTAYNSSATYNVGDQAIESGKLWMCKKNGVSGITPSGSTTEWEMITDTFNTSLSDLPREVGLGGSILSDYYLISGDCYKATRVICNIKPIYGLISITEPEISTVVTQIDNPNYSYYKISRFPLGISWRELTGIYSVDETSETYARKGVLSYSPFITTYEYYRKQISIPNNDLYDSTTSEVYVGKIFKVFYNGSYKYFQLKKNPEELLSPVDFPGSTETNSIGYLGNSKYAGNLILVKDGYGKNSSGLFIDFNDFSYKVQSFEEKIDLKQKRSTQGIITNFGESEEDQYRLYLSDSPDKNTITISVSPESTEVSGMIGLFTTTSELTNDSGISGVLPGFNTISSPGCNIISNQTLPKLDGGQTKNFIINFSPNTGDQDIIHEFEFYTSENGFNTRVYLKVIQLSDPGTVTILGPSNLYFLSNGLLQNSGRFLDFNSTIDINLNNIEILNDQGEDILDRGDEDNPISYVNPISITNGSMRYRAFLKLKPNTTNHAYNEFRIKIGKISGNTVTDRTIIGDGRFYKYTESGWILLGSEYYPTWLENYVTELPIIANIGDIVCVCNSLRGSQGYYSVALYNPRITSDFNNTTGLEIRRAETGEEISDLRSALGIDEEVNLDTLAIIVSELPEKIQQSGLIYKIGNTYYYTYADCIISDFILGSPQVPIEIGSSSVDEQKFHLKVTQLEYDSLGYVTTTDLTNTIFISGQNYRLSNDRSEFFSGIVEEESNRIYSGYYNSQIIYSSTSIPSFVPYLSTRYEFSEQSDISSIITIKSIIDLELKYNYSGPVIPEDYMKIKNTFTIYIRKSR